jgi:hypothetical protein
MAHTYEDLKHKTVGELREIAQGIDHDAVKGFTQMNKEHLLKAICTALHIDMHAHREVVGVDKASLKARIKQLKEQRAQALEAHDSAQLKAVRRHIHSLKRQMHKATVQTPGQGSAIKG